MSRGLGGLALTLGLACSPEPPPPASIAAAPMQRSEETCPREQVGTIAGLAVWRLPGGAVGFVAGMAVDADGAPRAYHPDDQPGLDRLANAGAPGRWWALVTDDGTPSGRPQVQGPGDPAPGFYVSMTSLVDPRWPAADPRRYVDASRVPYVALPRAALRRWSARLGDLVAVHEPRSGRTAFAIFADVGPADALGEGSIALAEALGLPASPRSGGTAEPLVYVVFPGSAAPREPAEIERAGTQRLATWGGAEQLAACFAEARR